MVAVQLDDDHLFSLYDMSSHSRSMLDNVPGIDRLDADLLRLLSEEPRIGVLEASRRLGVALA